MILTGNCAVEILGFPTCDFGGGRRNTREADTSTCRRPEVWDPTNVESFDGMVARDKRWRGKNGDADYDSENPLAATHQALINVDPEGRYARGDLMGSARDIRVAFTRMAMNDEETVALIAGGHAFGKSHAMVSPTEGVRWTQEPEKLQGGSMIRYCSAADESRGFSREGLARRSTSVSAGMRHGDFFPLR